MNQSNESHNYFDTWIKFITAVIVSISIAAASWQFKEGVENQFLAPLWEKRVEVYSKAVSISAAAANSDDKNELIKLRKELDSLLMGEFRVVGDTTITIPVGRFLVELSECSKENSCTREKLSPLARSISTCSKKSLGTAWDLRFEEIVEESSDRVVLEKLCS